MGTEPTISETTRHDIGQSGDSVIVQQTAESMAETIGFDESACSEIGIVALELASNVRKHAESGEIAVSHIRDDSSDGIRIESFDVGPGIPNVGEAFADGASTAGSLGGGLGAVNRLMDQLTVTAPGEPDFGTRVVADRWLRPPAASTILCPYSFGAASRPKPDEAVNGDSFVIKRWNNKALVGVIDGLGHGAAAHEAAIAAKEYIETHYDQPIKSIFKGADRACRGTRGVVLAIARFDWEADSVALGAVGNIDYKVSDTSDLSLIPRRGVVGDDPPEPRIARCDWHPTDTLVLFSDGIESRWNLSDERSIHQQSATKIARQLLDSYSKPHDDATVLVVSERVDN